MPRRLLSLWLPHWHTTLWHKAHPHSDPALPLALYGRDGQSRKIVAVNRAALESGVQKGQFLAMARSLVPDLATHPVTPERDARGLQKLAEWCRCFSPLVAADPPEGLWIDSTGCAHLFGGEARMLEALRDRLAERGHDMRAALADTAGAAHALARHGDQQLTCVPPGESALALAGLPVAALRLTPEIQAGLSLMGITRVSDLRAVPRASLTRRFGMEPLFRLDQALGQEKEALCFDRPVAALHVKRALLEPIGTAESLLHVVTVLCDDMAALLQKMGLGARRLDLLCQRVDDVTQAIRVGTSEPVSDPSRLSRLFQERIETIDPGFGIEVMSLHVDHAEPRQPADETPALNPSALTDPEEQQMPAMLVELAERLRNRPGLRGIYHLAATDSPFPEEAQKPVVRLARLPTVSRTPASSWSGTAQDGFPRLWPRPVRLFAAPCAIAPPALAEDDSPRRFVWQGQMLRVRGADGPERLHGAWWQHPVQAGAIRDYWIVETEEGDRFWLFRRGDGQHPWSGDGAWFVHGVF
ncbi:DUF6504 family protein [Asaia sp. VD9]|uniref:DUF6504 family protein n=1 Tax=Asaia sp. VD9 TaxID=3081235 RepID=UPI00301B5D60